MIMSTRKSLGLLKKIESFWPKSWVTGVTKIRPDIESQIEFDSQYRVNLAQIFSNYLESRVEF